MKGTKFRFYQYNTNTDKYFNPNMCGITQKKIFDHIKTMYLSLI